MTIDELRSAAAVVRDATEEGENTATRIGQLFLDTVNTLCNVLTNAIKGYVVISSTSDLPTSPTTDQQMKGYLLDTTLYVWVGTGGDTLDGKYQSAQLKGEDGKTGPKGDSGVSLGDVVLVNDLTTGGEGNALSAEMGKVLAESCGVEKGVFTQTLAYNAFPAKGDYPIMIAGKTYSIHIQGNKPMGQTQWELWGRTASGTATIRKFGSTDMSVEQVITYTPAADIYAIGCNYSSGVQDTTVMITYTIPYNDYTCVLREDMLKLSDDVKAELQGFGDILEVDKIVVLDVTDIIKGQGNSTWYYEQSTPIMRAGCNYTIIVKSDDSYTPNRWELWGKNKSGTAIKINLFTSVDLSEGQSTVYTPTNDIYSLYCGYNTSSIDTKFEYKVVTDYGESQRLFGVEKSTTEINETLKKAEINVYSDYYKMGSVKNDTYNLASRPIGLIVMGQSNADGRIPNSSFPATATIDTTDDLILSKQLTHCLFMKGDQEGTYGEASKNFAARNNSGNWAFDDIVYNAVNQALGGETDFYVIKQTRGDTGIVDMAFPNFNANVDRCKESGMSKNSQLYHFKGLIERALELNTDINFKAILWHQGEREWNSYKQGPYYEALCQMIYWLRGKVGNPKLPFIFGTVPTDSAQYSAIVKADMERVAQDINDCYLVDLGAAGDMIDQFHFGASTAERLAREMYKIMRQNYMLAPMINPL